MEINKENYYKLLGKDVRQMYSIELMIARILGYVKKTNIGYKLTAKGALIYHDIEQKYTHAYIDKMWNISRVTAFPKSIKLM